MIIPALMEPALGVVDGMNRDFRTSRDYVRGSLQAWVNILRRREHEDGWEETGTRTFRLREAPLPGDRVFAWYRPV